MSCDCLPVPSPQRCRVVNIPGFPGADGAPGADGRDGVNAYTTVTSPFVVPNIGSTVTIEVENTSWMVQGEGAVYGQALAIQFGGTFLITQIVDDTHVTIINPGYIGNAPAGTTVPALSRVGVSGVQGPGGSGTGVLQIFPTHGFPVTDTFLFPGQDPTLQSIAIDYDPPQSWYTWDVDQQKWIAPPEIP